LARGADLQRRILAMANIAALATRALDILVVTLIFTVLT
jgi:hypothetical protein